MLTHGTTLHGLQSTDPARQRAPATYYGPTSGVGLALRNAQTLFGQQARIGVVGLGTGTLACYNRPGETWRFYEIDPVVLAYSRDRTFTYLADCASDAKVVIGDARLELAQEPKATFDVLAIDAFSSDAIPLHLLTNEAIGVYLDALAPDGLLLIHISNRYVDLEPTLAAAARLRGLAARVRTDSPPEDGLLTGSVWVLLTRDSAKLTELRRLSGDAKWNELSNPARRVWTDDHASILPYVRWNHMIGKR
jgi:spermidine synthase